MRLEVLHLGHRRVRDGAAARVDVPTERLDAQVGQVCLEGSAADTDLTLHDEERHGRWLLWLL